MAKGTDTLSQIGGGALGTLALLDAAHSGNLFQVLAQRQHLLQDPGFRASLQGSPGAAGMFFVGGQQGTPPPNPIMRGPGIDTQQNETFIPSLAPLNPKAAYEQQFDTELQRQLSQPNTLQQIVNHKLGIPLGAAEMNQQVANLMAQLPPGTSMHPQYVIGPDGGIRITLAEQPDLSQLGGVPGLIPTGYSINPHGGLTTNYGFGPEATRTQQQDANIAAGEKRKAQLLEGQAAAVEGQPPMGGQPMMPPPAQPIQRAPIAGAPPTAAVTPQAAGQPVGQPQVGYPSPAPIQSEQVPIPDLVRIWNSGVVPLRSYSQNVGPPPGLPNPPGGYHPSPLVVQNPTELPMKANIAGVESVFLQNRRALRATEKQAGGLQGPVNARLTALAEMVDAATYLRNLTAADPQTIGELIGNIDIASREAQFQTGTLPPHLKKPYVGVHQAMATLKRFLFTEAGKRVTGPELDILAPLFPRPEGPDPQVFQEQVQRFLDSAAGRLATEMAGTGDSMPDQYRETMNNILRRAGLEPPATQHPQRTFAQELGYDAPAIAGGIAGGTLGGAVSGGNPLVAAPIASTMAALGSAGNRMVRKMSGAYVRPDSSTGTDALAYGAFPETLGPAIRYGLGPLAVAAGERFPIGLGAIGGLLGMMGHAPESAGQALQQLAPGAVAGMATGMAAPMAEDIGRFLTPDAAAAEFRQAVRSLADIPTGIQAAGRAALRAVRTPQDFLDLFNNPNFGTLYHSKEAAKAMRELSTRAIKLGRDVPGRLKDLALRAGLRIPGFVEQAEN